MPEEVKLSSYDSSLTSKDDYKSDDCLSTDGSNAESSSIDVDHSDREMSRSETSSCSDESSCYKQNGRHESVEIIPTRTIKTATPKPAANPLQFVKIGPCDLYRSAHQQLQKVNEIKKQTKKEFKDEMEDWQSNLDSWKFNRRKQQEHIIERVVEVKKLELEEHDRNKKKTKTFSEMMEERTSKGRKTSLPVYLEEESDDLSDLGISSNKGRSDSETIPEESNDEDCEKKSYKLNNGSCDGVDEPDNVSSCEATYESAIQCYESRMKSLTSNRNAVEKKITPISTSSSTASPTKKYVRRSSAAKIEEKLCELERIKNRSMSSSDLVESNKKSINIPKVNIFKRKEIFEKFTDGGDGSKGRRASEEFLAVRSIKDRLSSLEKTVEETGSTKSKTVLVSDVSVKDRLSFINKRFSQEIVEPEKIISRERFCGGSSKSVDETAKPTAAKVERERKDDNVATVPNSMESSENAEGNSCGRSTSSEEYEVADVRHPVNHYHHRSLDSLQGPDSTEDFCFDRVQSLECIDCCSNYPASILSGDTDREDSGIHTADVSSSVSQADDFDLHADTSMDVDVKSQSNVAAAPSDALVKIEKSSHENELCLDSQRDESVTEHRRLQQSNEVIEFERKVEQQVQAVPNVDCDNESNQIDGKKEAAKKEEEEDEEDEVIDVQIEENQRRSEFNLDSTSIAISASVSTFSQNIEEEKIIKAENVKEAAQVEEEIRNDENKRNLVVDECSFESVKVNNKFILEKQPNFDYTNSINEQLGDSSSKNFAPPNEIFNFETAGVTAEPPKEKPPPPPPLENSDEEVEKIEDANCLRRMDSTKRIKKEMRLKRSSFLGIEGYDDDSYLEPELEAVKPPPDMTTFLEEERRLEKMLYRQSICSESDSTQGESRDSGVELDKNQNDENSWAPDRVHSREDSETYANTSTTSEEDEIIKKEREILEILELEEQRNYQNEMKNDCSNLGEKLVLKLKELEHQKNVTYWEQGPKLEQSCMSERSTTYTQPIYQNYGEQILAGARQSADAVMLQQQWTGRSLQDVSQNESAVMGLCEGELNSRVEYRNSMPNIQQQIEPPPMHYHKQAPPPIPASKPAHLRKPAVINKTCSPQQMSKTTLAALSAVPKSKIMATDSWVQTKKKPRQETYNYQHWLIQEAEHRRITEYQQRQCKENVVGVAHNYVNVQPDSADAADELETTGTERRIPSHINRSSLYAHPQMLPYRNQNQNYKNYDRTSQTKISCSSSNNHSSIHSINHNINDHCTNNASSNNKPLPDSVIQTLTQRVQNRFAINDTTKQKRRENLPSNNSSNISNNGNPQEKMLSVSGKKKCSHCGEELGRGAAMIIESLRLFYHIDCFRCCVCCVQLGDGLMGTDVRVRNSKLHCHSCYSNDEGLKFSCV